MRLKLIIDGNAVYEIDENCLSHKGKKAPVENEERPLREEANLHRNQNRNIP